MTTIDKLQSRALLAFHDVQVRYARAVAERERGDVPGWVLITIMTAGLVTALWATAQGTLTSLFNTAVQSVTGGGR
ncbi:hypothetical protein HJ588_07970 [Flexivirga sp. ID2601S]|uniref:Uncharacterized protein n=1 Tax=Flexivirga aerilata TaxID=1656889 RepID=A0A849AFK8_9MICO|nr:hypothetical protein [Flexivirga aerilata]NNG39209.1 hypothetical protein [Flexivirga aerilata]